MYLGFRWQTKSSCCGPLHCLQAAWCLGAGVRRRAGHRVGLQAWQALIGALVVHDPQECLFHPVMVAEPRAKEGRAMKLAAELTQVAALP